MVVVNGPMSIRQRVCHNTQVGHVLPNLSALFRRHVSIDVSGTGKRKVDGELAATRLGQPATEKWTNERFRQVLLLVREFRVEWPNKSLLTADDVEFLRVCLDVALSTASHENHTADIYDLNATTWAIWMVQHAHAVRNGAWTAESAAAQNIISFETLYAWLAEQHARGESFKVADATTERGYHRYKLPFKQMNVPPKSDELFKWRKGAARLSGWMERGGLAPIDPGIRALEEPQLVAAPPLQAQRETRRAAMWTRVAERARARALTSVEPRGEDAALTRRVVNSVMANSRADAPMMADSDAEDLERELEAALEGQQAAEPPPPPSSSQAGPSSSSQPQLLSEYELERLRNIARNQEVLRGLGLLENSQLLPPAKPAPPPKDPFPPGRGGAAPSRRSERPKAVRNYSEAETDQPEGEASVSNAPTSAPPPGSVVISLVSDDEEGEAPTPLPPDPTRRDGLFIAQSRVAIETGPSAGSLLSEPGLFTLHAIPAGSFVCFYTGAWYSDVAFDGLPPARRSALSRYAVEIEDHNVTLAPATDETGAVDFVRNAAAAANEPSASSAANSFAQASVVERLGMDAELHSYLTIGIYTCRPVAAGDEILWNYGAGYDALRQEAGYTAGESCPDAAIDSVRLPSPLGRVRAILTDGGRVTDALHELELTSASEGDDTDWSPVGGRVRRRRRS